MSVTVINLYPIYNHSILIFDNHTLRFITKDTENYSFIALSLFLSLSANSSGTKAE
jgi:hypothetical protein